MNIAIHTGEPLANRTSDTGFRMDELVPRLLALNEPAGPFEFYLPDFHATTGPASWVDTPKHSYPRPASSFSGIGKWWWTRVSFPSYLKRNNIGVILSTTPGERFSKRIIVVELNETLLSASASGGVFTGVAGSEKPVHAGSQRLPRGVRGGFEPDADETKEQTRQRFTRGTMYLFYQGPADERILPLIKAFSIFKKRQKTGWLLVIADDGSSEDAAFRATLGNYRYRDELLIIGPGQQNEFPALLKAAYGVLVLSPAGYNALAPECFRAGIPVIAPETAVNPAFGGDAVLTFASTEPIHIADEMMLLYKDEHLRARLVMKGNDVAAGLSWDLVAGALQEFLERALSGNSYL